MKPLARKFGVTDSAIKSWLRGSKPVKDKISNACKRTGISLEWLRHGDGNATNELAKVDPAAPHNFPSQSQHQHQESRPVGHTVEAAADYDSPESGWPVVVRILAARLNSKQIAEALKEILDGEEIDESVSKSASQILVNAQLPKLNR